MWGGEGGEGALACPLLHFISDWWHIPIHGEENPELEGPQPTGNNNQIVLIVA